MSRIGTCLKLVLLLVLACSGARAGGLRKIWELRLAREIKEGAGQPAVEDHIVSAVSFSPRGAELAVVVDMHRTERYFTSHLLLISIESPRRVLRQLELEHGLMPEDYRSIFWSQDGRFISVGSRVIQLGNGTQCDASQFKGSVEGLIDSRAVVDSRTMRTNEPWEKPVTSLGFVEPDCRWVDLWDLTGERWAVDDLDPATGLAAIERLGWVGQGTVEFLVIHLVDRNVKQRWPADVIGGRGERAQLADNGKAMCAGSGVDSRKHEPARCWDVQTGKEIGEVPSVNGGWPIVAAANAPRIIATDWRYQPYIIMDGYTQILRKRVVWDFRAGKVLASWRPGKQRYTVPLPKFPKDDWRQSPFAFDLSPNGRYVAEGGNGVLRLYEIEP